MDAFPSLVPVPDAARRRPTSTVASLLQDSSPHKASASAGRTCHLEEVLSQVRTTLHRRATRGRCRVEVARLGRSAVTQRELRWILPLAPGRLRA